MPLDIPRSTATGSSVEMVEVTREGGGTMKEPWSALADEPRIPGKYTLRFSIGTGASALEIPACAGRVEIRVDANVAHPPKGPFVAAVDKNTPHDVAITVDVSSYEKRIRCSYAPRAGNSGTTSTGLLRLTYASPDVNAGGGHATVFLPSSYDEKKPMPMLVGLHPWNGDEWTYANYSQMLDEAERDGVILLMTNGLGNSLYGTRAEAEVMRAVDEAEHVLAVDPARVSIWGASMGGQGATTVGFHHPDRFANVTSFFGDARFDLNTYAKIFFPTEADAHRTNPIDDVENARWQSVLLVHGEADHTSKISESEALDAALRKWNYRVTFARHPGMGHEAPVILLHIRDVVQSASFSVIPSHPARVTFKSVRVEDTSAYGVSIERAHAGDAFVDLECGEDHAIHVHVADNVKSIRLEAGAICGQPNATVAFDPNVTARPKLVWQ